MQRLKGQEVELVFLVDGAPRTNLTTKRSLEIEYKFSLLAEGYLGETTQRYDTIYDGVGLRTEFHLETPDAFEVALLIEEKARRREPGTQFNWKCTYNFPSGRKARIVIPEFEFGPSGFNVGGRGEYVVVPVEGAASQAFVLVS